MVTGVDTQSTGCAAHLMKSPNNTFQSIRDTCQESKAKIYSAKVTPNKQLMQSANITLKDLMSHQNRDIPR